MQYTDLQQHAIWLLKLHGFCLNNLPRLPPSWQGWNPDLLVWVVMPPKMILSYPLAGPAVALCCGGDLLMSKVQPIVRGILRRQRQVLPILTLGAHLLTAVGFPAFPPLAGRSGLKAESGVPFPCQNRPCGCLTAEQCWAGDCCCFTLAEKVAWAKANGVPLPPSVQERMAAQQASAGNGSRRGSASVHPSSNPSEQTTNCCCSTSGTSSLPDSGCCQPAQASGMHSCAHSRNSTGKAATLCEESSNNCPHKAAANGCLDCRAESPNSWVKGNKKVHWIIGIYAQRCRGLVALYLGSDLAFIPMPTLNLAEEAPCVGILEVVCEHLYTRAIAPPVPPPRQG